MSFASGICRMKLCTCLKDECRRSEQQTLPTCVSEGVLGRALWPSAEISPMTTPSASLSDGKRTGIINTSLTWDCGYCAWRPWRFSWWTNYRMVREGKHGLIYLPLLPINREIRSKGLLWKNNCSFSFVANGVVGVNALTDISHSYVTFFMHESYEICTCTGDDVLCTLL